MEDLFLKIGDIKGECKDFEFKEWIEVLSWSWGANQVGTGGHGTGMSASKISFQDMSFTMHYCAASPALFASLTSGKHHPEARLVQRKSTGEGGQKKFLEFTFKDVIVTSYQTGGSGSGLPVESCSLNFTSVQQEYFAQDEKGVPKSAGKAGWSVKENKKI